jgi:hypothetical protein
MQDNSPVSTIEADEPVIDLAYIENDIGVVRRTCRNYIAKGILPPPDSNLLGRDLWRLSTYRKFKADLLQGKFVLPKRNPALLRDSKSAA